MALTFGNLATVSVTNDDDLDWAKLIVNSEEPKPIIMVEDPIAISCVLYRMRQETFEESGRSPNLFSLKTDAKLLASSITGEDRFLAENIRKFYNGKLTVARLRSERISNFRQDLTKLLLLGNDGTGYEVPDTFIGMLYKLPYFYEYDRNLIDLFGGEYFNVSGNRKRGNKGKLSFLGKLDTFRKRSPQYEYWFADEEDSRVVVSIEKANPLNSLFEHYAEDFDLNVEGLFRHSRRDNLEFYKLTNWQIKF